MYEIPTEPKWMVWGRDSEGQIAAFDRSDSEGAANSAAQNIRLIQEVFEISDASTWRLASFDRERLGIDPESHPGFNGSWMTANSVTLTRYAHRGRGWCRPRRRRAGALSLANRLLSFTTCRSCSPGDARAQRRQPQDISAGGVKPEGVPSQPRRRNPFRVPPLARGIPGLPALRSGNPGLTFAIPLGFVCAGNPTERGGRTEMKGAHSGMRRPIHHRE